MKDYYINQIRMLTLPGGPWWVFYYYEPIGGVDQQWSEHHIDSFNLAIDWEEARWRVWQDNNQPLW